MRVDDGDDGVASHGKSQGAALDFFLVQFAREHGEIGHAIQNIRHAFPCSAGRDIDPDARVQPLEFIFPFQSQWIEGEGPGDRHLSRQVFAASLSGEVSAGGGQP